MPIQVSADLRCDYRLKTPTEDSSVFMEALCGTMFLQKKMQTNKKVFEEYRQKTKELDLQRASQTYPFSEDLSETQLGYVRGKI